MIPKTRAQELAQLYDDHSEAASPIRAIGKTGRMFSDGHRAKSLIYLRDRTFGATVGECRQIRSLIDYALHAPLEPAGIEEFCR